MDFEFKKGCQLHGLSEHEDKDGECPEGPGESHPERLVGKAWCSWFTLGQGRWERLKAFGSQVAVTGKQELGP